MYQQTHVYSSKLSIHRGRPIFEILKDGQPFWEDLPGAKDHFSFGIDKAVLLLICMPLIEQFLDSTDLDLKLLKPREMTDAASGDSCTITGYPGFKRHGAWVEKPYLEITGKKKIAFGRLKADAISILQNEIRKFASYR